MGGIRGVCEKPLMRRRGESSACLLVVMAMSDVPVGSVNEVSCVFVLVCCFQS